MTEAVKITKNNKKKRKEKKRKGVLEVWFDKEVFVFLTKFTLFFKVGTEMWLDIQLS